MTEDTVPKLAKWPFFLGDLFLLGLAAAIVFRSEPSFGRWQIMVCVACVGIAAWLCVLPFLHEYRAAVKLAESQGLATTVEQIQNLERIAGQIAAATGQWQIVHEQAGQTAGTAKEVAAHIAAEARAFAEMMQKANDQEKGHLRLEIEKLRRGEGEWLQILVRLLDNVYALYMAGARSNQPGLAEQLGQFQNVCRDIVRRVGLVSFGAKPGEPFDAKLHQLIDVQAPAPARARVAETLAPGYTFQGQLLRPAVVNLQTETAEIPSPTDSQPMTVTQTAQEVAEPTLP